MLALVLIDHADSDAYFQCVAALYSNLRNWKVSRYAKAGVQVPSTLARVKDCHPASQGLHHRGTLWPLPRLKWQRVTDMQDAKSNVREYSPPTISEILSYLVLDRGHKSTSMVLVHLVSAAFQLCWLVLVSERVLFVVVAYCGMTLEAKRERIVYFSGAVSINVGNLDVNPARLSTQTAMSTAPEENPDLVFFLELMSRLTLLAAHLRRLPQQRNQPAPAISVRHRNELLPVPAPIRVRGDGEQVPADELQVFDAESEDRRFASAAWARARRPALAVFVESDGHYRRRYNS